MFGMTPAHLWMTAYLITAASGALVVLIRLLNQAPTPDQKEVAMKKWMDLIKLLAPAILGTIPGVPSVLIPTIVTGINVAEQIPGATGAQKKAAVLAEVQLGLDATNSVRPGTISSVDTVGAVSAGIDAAVSAINAVHSVHQALPAPPPPPVV